MKTSLSCGLCALSALSAVLLFTIPQPLSGQAAANPEEAEVLLMADEIATQQLLIRENHLKMDEKIAAIGEDVRQTRIFASRGGNRR